MYSKEFQQAFSRFYDNREYDQIQKELFVMVSTAFLAGWRAAGGELGPVDPPLTFYQSLLEQEGE